MFCAHTRVARENKIRSLTKYSVDRSLSFSSSVCSAQPLPVIFTSTHAYDHLGLVTPSKGHMVLSSIRARVVCTCVALVVFSIVSSMLTNYFIAKASIQETIENNLTSLTDNRAVVIGEWVAAKMQMVSSLREAVLTPDSMRQLDQVAAAGGFWDVGVGYPDKTAESHGWPNIPPSYDPTSRPWYRAAVQAGKPVASRT